MKGEPKRRSLDRSVGVIIQMKQKYMRVELGTGYCGETSIQYYKLEDQTKTGITKYDWDYLEQLAIEHNESYGRDYADYCDQRELDPEDDTYWDDYMIDCCENCYIEIVEADPEDEDDSTFDDGFIENRTW